VASVRRATLAQIFVLATGAILLVLALSLGLFLRAAQRSILDLSERSRRSAAQRIEGEVARALGTATDALAHVSQSFGSGALSPDEMRALEVALYTELKNLPHLAEVSFVRAHLLGYDSAGEARLAARGRFQLSAIRSSNGALVTRLIREENGEFVAQTRDRPLGSAFDQVPFVDSGPAQDPTRQATFSVPIANKNTGRVLWSDLHYSEIDAGLPNPRVVLSVQQAVLDPRGSVLGVLRVALLTTDLDAISKLRVDSGNPNDLHRIALLAVSPSGARRARLVARLSANDRIELVGQDLRFVPDRPTPEMAELLASPLMRDLDPEHPNAEGEFRVNGQRYLATLRELSVAEGGTEGWLVAILVPVLYYTKDLRGLARLLSLVFGVTLLAIILIGALTLRVVERGLARVVHTTARMRRFDFAPDSTHSHLFEIDELMSGLERAKTAVRAMGKYVPLDLVRRLYASNEEPKLGGELRSMSLMFSDIEGFTGLAERLSPAELARHLGAYLEAMTRAVENASGTIDKYIGDAVMAFWNAPSQIEQHSLHACEAVLACKEAVSALYASPAWLGLPPFVTRFGVHTAKVMVGNFGAPSRLSYTVLGDGVNLAARLEPLCKQYGVTALVSETVVEAARAQFVFRRIDRVAVKGKTRSIDVYELLGRSGSEVANLPQIERYHAAFNAYLERDFAHAVRLLEDVTGDPPSEVLRARCEQLQKSPPPDDWNGVHVSMSK
jgi:adenylate cyclase